MIGVLHFDGLVLLIESMCLTWLGADYRRWQFRAPILAMAFCDFALSVNLLGLYRPTFAPHWFWLRLVADSSTLLIIGMYVGARRGHAKMFMKQSG